MIINFDGRVLGHQVFSGVENYAINIYEVLKTRTTVILLQPASQNRYLQQLWEHTLLPFAILKNELLFCPANITPLYLTKKVTLVMTLHDVAFRTFPGSFSKVFSMYYSWIVPRSIRRANQIITVSESSKKEILHFYPDAEGKISVIPLGVHSKFRVLPTVRKQKQILYVGSINERKNIVGVIEAFEKLPETLECTLVIIGNFFGNFSLSARMQQTLERATSNSCIVFKSGLDDEALIYEYNTAACLIFPSFYEGFGLPPLEAMACGTPVITSNLSSMPEVCGDVALYVNPYDTNAIANMMQSVLEDEELQNALKIKGLEHVKHYSWEKAAQAHVDVFKKVLEG